MIDPVSIGMAFAAAQGVVSNIKSAINTGKDIMAISNDIGKFLQLSSDVNKANIELKHKLLNTSDSELEAQALKASMMAHQIEEQRKQLKELLVWSGNGHIWDNMVMEHTRLLKEKRELERRQELERRRKQQQLLEILFITIMVIVGLVAILPIVYVVVKIFTVY